MSDWMILYDETCMKLMSYIWDNIWDVMHGTLSMKNLCFNIDLLASLMI